MLPMNSPFWNSGSGHLKSRCCTLGLRPAPKFGLTETRRRFDKCDSFPVPCLARYPNLPRATNLTALVLASLARALSGPCRESIVCDSVIRACAVSEMFLRGTGSSGRDDCKGESNVSPFCSLAGLGRKPVTTRIRCVLHRLKSSARFLMGHILQGNISA